MISLADALASEHAAPWKFVAFEVSAEDAGLTNMEEKARHRLLLPWVGAGA
jgi:hypothetical protein